MWFLGIQSQMPDKQRSVSILLKPLNRPASLPRSPYQSLTIPVGLFATATHRTFSVDAFGSFGSQLVGRDPFRREGPNELRANNPRVVSRG